VLILTAVFGCRLWFERDPGATAAHRLSGFPNEIGAWHKVREDTLNAETRGVLRADDYLARTFEVLPGTQAQIFVAYYRTQHSGETFHSPRNCLPGSGWEPVSASLIDADLGLGRSVRLNRYLVERNGQRLLVIYWYQEHERIIADELQGKFYLVWDAIRLHRRDGALVRFSLPLGTELSEAQADDQLLRLIRAAASPLRNLLFR
jgi:EpsI family protein